MDLSPLSEAPPDAPLYEQVKHALLMALMRGEWTQGGAIPPEKQLAVRLGVSIGTLRKAVDDLVAENILVRRQGRGTYVAEHSRNAHFFKFFRIVRQDGHKSYPVTTLQRFGRVRASALVREKLGLASGAYVFEFSNVLALNGDVVQVDDISLPEARFTGLNERQLRERVSTLYSFYQEFFGVNVIATDERLRCCVAQAQHAAWLGVAQGASLLEVRRVAYSYSRQPVEWRISRVNTENYEYLGQDTTQL
ncbi:GntR family transcriptional regulator [Bordetella sp. FB-8]|uniref:GntR family transcriptional regulator n=1 Tax=Bordetella sp. FB-8 TaxID=1159870 RepID=UPI00037C7E71|nr:GntR family transcriptional regulator [Bordetella sp. FB-8]